MVRWFSLTKILTTAILGLALFVAFRSGWMPVEFGGTPTGSLVDSESGIQTVDPSEDVSSLPEFEVDDGPPQVHIGDGPREWPAEQTQTTTKTSFPKAPPIIGEPSRSAHRSGTNSRTSPKSQTLATTFNRPLPRTPSRLGHDCDSSPTNKQMKPRSPCHRLPKVPMTTTKSETPMRKPR